MSLKRKIIHRVGTCLEELHRLRSLCRDGAQSAELDAVIELMHRAFEVAENARALGSAERRPKASVFALDQAANGQPFVVPAHQVASARVAASSWGKRHGVRLAVRKQQDGSAIVSRADDDAF